MMCLGVIRLPDRSSGQQNKLAHSTVPILSRFEQVAGHIETFAIKCVYSILTKIVFG